MAITQPSDVFVPQVIAQVATDILFEKTPLLRTGVVKNAGNDVWSEGGSTVTFPYFNTTTTDMVQTAVEDSRTGVTPSKISVTTYTETLASKVLSFDATKYTFRDASAKTDLNMHIAELVAKLSAKDIQDALITDAEATSLSYDQTAQVTKTPTVDGILSAKMQRGEYAQDGDPILFLHSTQFLNLAKTDDYKTLTSSATTAIAAATSLPPGVVGWVHGVWIVLSDAINVNTGVYNGLMIWPGALGLYIKQEIEHKHVMHAGTTVETDDFDFRYATTLYRNNPRGVVLYQTN